MPTDLVPSLRLARLPVWRELGAARELSALHRDPIWSSPSTADGLCPPVLLVPGLLARDGSMAPLRDWLRRGGYRVHAAQLGFNTQCGSRSVAQLEEVLEDAVATAKRRAVVVGHSRGGQHARVLAARRPELVQAVLTLGTPQRRMWAMHPALKSMQLAAAGIGSASGLPGLPRVSCMREAACCSAYRSALQGDLPDSVQLVAAYTRADAVVDWRDCLDPHARLVELPGTHCGLIYQPQAFRLVAELLHA